MRNSSADENARTSKPNSRNRSGSDSRTDSSSSTTDTSKRFLVIKSSCSHPATLRPEFVTAGHQHAPLYLRASIVLWYWFVIEISESKVVSEICVADWSAIPKPTRSVNLDLLVSVEHTSPRSAFEPRCRPLVRQNLANGGNIR